MGRSPQSRDRQGAVPLPGLSPVFGRFLTGAALKEGGMSRTKLQKRFGVAVGALVRYNMALWH